MSFCRQIFIVGHGNGQEPRLDVGFGPSGTIDRISYGPEELADLLIEDGLACDHAKVTLLLVQGGMTLSKQQVNKRYIELYRKVSFRLVFNFVFLTIFSKIRSRASQTKEEQEELRGEWGSLAMRSRDPDL